MFLLRHGRHVWEQGWRSGESARLPPMCPGIDSPTRRHMWVEFVVGSLLRFERFFSGYSGFPLSSKTNTSKFQFDLETVDEEPPRGNATANPIIILLLLLLLLLLCLCPSEGHKHGDSIQSSLNLGNTLLRIARE